MIDAGTLLTYLAIVFGFVFIPGPATLLTVARATSSGMRAGIATGAGIAAGDLVHTILAIAGISAILAASASLFSIVKYVGAAYLFYLGAQAILTKSSLDESAGSTAVSAWSAFKQGFVTEILNPKTALFFLAFLPQFVNPAKGMVVVQLLLLGVLFVLLGLLSTVAFAVTAGSLSRVLRKNSRFLRWRGRLVGGIYCGLALGLVAQDR